MATVEEMTLVTTQHELYRQPGGCLEILETKNDVDMVHICDPWQFLDVIKQFLTDTDALRDRDWPELAKDEKRGQ